MPALHIGDDINMIKDRVITTMSFWMASIYLFAYVLTLELFTLMFANIFIMMFIYMKTKENLRSLKKYVLQR